MTRRTDTSMGRGPLQVLSYLALVPVLRALARLPLSTLYRLSDAGFFLIYRVLRVRRGVARANLRRAFPDAAPEEIARIEERAFRNFCDVAVEGLWLLSASRDQVAARMKADLAPERELMEQGRSAIYVLGHCGNWEWAIPATAAGLPDLMLHVVYHPLRHAGFDALVRATRERWGAILTPMEEAPRAIVRLRRQVTATILVADQRPRSHNAHRTRFLGAETGFLRGPERLARRLGMPVLFVAMRRVARGRYAFELEWLCRDPSASADGEITEAFARRLERQILAAPDDWLWLHRRWRDRRAERGEGAESLETPGV